MQETYTQLKLENANPQVIEFRVEFNDVVTDNNVDNNVDGALTSSVQQYRAVGPNSITSISPTYFTSTSLAGFNVPVDANTPTYTLSSDKTTVNEGSTLTLSLNTSNVANGVAVPYAITGVVGSDIGMAPLSGNFIINANGQASLILNITSDLATEGVEALTLALNNGLASVTVTIADTSNSASAYNYDPEWYAEFATNSWLTGIPKTTAVNIGTAMNDAFFQGTGSYTNNLGQVRYALARKADATGLAYWTKQFYNSYGATFTVGNIGFQRTFFSSVDASTTILSGLGSTQSDAQRTLLATKPFLAGNGNGPFHDRGTTVSVPATPAPPSASFVFTVTPSTGMNFNVLSSYGKVTFYYNIAVAVGSGAGDISYSLNYPSVTTSPTASKTYFLGTNQARSIQLYIHPTSTGTFTGSFTFFEASGVGSTVTKGWGGTFTS